MAKQSAESPDDLERYGDTSLEFLRIDEDPEEMKDEPETEEKLKK